MTIPKGLPATCVYAFGMGVPKPAYRFMEVIALMFFGLMAAAAALLIPTILLITGIVLGASYLALKYYFRRKRSRLEPHTAPT